ncbi:hypothetical protein TNCV_4265011 [Trichonephila clavipes]|nr:hypothetical protein TNCV_4265011 [Trichonephila clavipes]
MEALSKHKPTPQSLHQNHVSSLIFVSLAPPSSHNQQLSAVLCAPVSQEVTFQSSMTGIDNRLGNSEPW